jgi:Holliday junction resolvase RusA-like endonuclease
MVGDVSMKWNFYVPAVKSWKRPEHQFDPKTKKVWVYTPEDLREWTKMIIEYAFRGGLYKYPPIAEVDIKMEITFGGRKWYRDLDNVAKGVLDALQPWFLADDKYLVKLTIERVESPSEWMDVSIEAPLIPTQLKEKKIRLLDTDWKDSGYLKDMDLRAVWKHGRFIIGNSQKVWTGSFKKTIRKLQGEHITHRWISKEDLDNKLPL